MSLLNNNVIAIAILCIVLIFNGLPMSNAFGDLLPFGEITKMEKFTVNEIKSAELLYFNSEGVAHPIRFLLAINNIQFNNNHFESNQWQDIKPTMPFHHVPLLVINDKLGLTQSDAICRFLAVNTIYNTDTPWEEYLVANYVDTFHDIRRDIKKFLREMEPKKSEMKKYFADKLLPIYMNKFENIVKNNGGYFVKAKFTMADIFFAGMVGAISRLSGVDALKNHESLTNLKNRVFEIEEIKDWLSNKSTQ